MSPGFAGGRPRPRSVGVGALFVPVLLLGGLVGGAALLMPLQAQVPDTVPRPPADTVPPPPADTIPDVRPPGPPVEDTVPPEPEPTPPPGLPRVPTSGPAGWDVGVWEWTRADLLRLTDLSLLHLLERIPGITPVRAASVGQPEAASVFGATTGAIRYEVDGFELDPLTAPTFDPSRFPLVALESVRVERRVTGARVRIRTLSPTDPRAQSVIEAATGDLRTNLFRGTFLAPRVLGGGLALGFESLGSSTVLGGTSTLTGGWVKWTWAREQGGIQAEYRQTTLDRSGTGTGLSGQRRDWVVRARHDIGPVTAEGYAGASSVEDELGAVTVREGTPQGGVVLRSALDGPVPLQAMAAVRLRGHPRRPAQEVDLAAWGEPVPWLGVGVELGHGRWAEGSPTTRWAVRGRAGPILGVTAFADLAHDPETFLRTAPGQEPGEPADPGRLELARDGARLGLQVQRGTLRLGTAVVRASADAVPGFGLEFDPGAPHFGGGEATGVEVTVRLPTGWRPLRLEGWYVGLDVPEAWLYLPADQWRAAVVFHDLPLPTGNLEIYARAEHRFRGRMAVPSNGGLGHVGAYRATDMELTIRVLTVRAFIRWNNLRHRLFQEDVPGLTLPGQHVIYGVKWEFWN